MTTLDDTNVSVAVTATVNPHGVCTVTCVPNELDMPSTPGMTINFTLTAPSGWVLKASNAVVVASPGTQFPNPPVTSADGLSCTLYDANTDNNPYDYTVYVVKATTGQAASLDPVIKNGGLTMTGGGGGATP